MKYNQLFDDYLSCKNPEEVFTYLRKTLIDTITSFDYFVDWEKIYNHVSLLEMDLNLLNFLIGKTDIEIRMTQLLKRYPSVVRTFPILIAVRANKISLLQVTAEQSPAVKTFIFKTKTRFSDEEISEILEFARNSGVTNLLQNKLNASIVDYVMGVEVGLDTNARKNRSGTDMEKLVEKVIKEICKNNKYKFMKQATARRLKSEWGYLVEVDKNQRRFDFAVLTNKNLYLFETNYYSGGGSKLKATAGEYKTIYNDLNAQNIHFVWITDGLGWETALNPLRETFNHIDYVLNLKMVNSGLLEKILEMDL